MEEKINTYTRLQTSQMGLAPVNVGSLFRSILYTTRYNIAQQVLNKVTPPVPRRVRDSPSITRPTI